MSSENHEQFALMWENKSNELTFLNADHSLDFIRNHEQMADNISLSPTLEGHDIFWYRQTLWITTSVEVELNELDTLKTWERMISTESDARTSHSVDFSTLTIANNLKKIPSFIWLCMIQTLFGSCTTSLEYPSILKWFDELYEAFDRVREQLREGNLNPIEISLAKSDVITFLHVLLSTLKKLQVKSRKYKTHQPGSLDKIWSACTHLSCVPRFLKSFSVLDSENGPLLGSMDQLMFFQKLSSVLMMKSTTEIFQASSDVHRVFYGEVKLSHTPTISEVYSYSQLIIRSFDIARENLLKTYYAFESSRLIILFDVHDREYKKLENPIANQSGLSIFSKRVLLKESAESFSSWTPPDDAKSDFTFLIPFGIWVCSSLWKTKHLFQRP